VNDKDFLDTNIVVYAYSHDEPEKQVVAKNLFKKTLPVVSTQVLGEFANVLRRKFRCEYPEIATVVTQQAWGALGASVGVVTHLLRLSHPPVKPSLTLPG